MNTILLIFGLGILILSIILITISSGNTNEKTKKTIHDYKEYKTIERDTKVTEKTIEEIDSVDEKIVYEKTEEFDYKKTDSVKVDIDNGEHIDITSQIMDMYDDGVSINNIAKKFNKGIREIDTIIKVNKTK